MIKFLIVDDEEIIRRGISNKVNKLIQDAEVVGEAADGEEALLKAEELRPDVIITDIKMPKLDGLLFIESALNLLPEAQFIVISGYQDFSYAQKALKLGVCDYLLKPVENNEFKSIVDRLIEKIKTRKEHHVYIDSLREQVQGNEIQRKYKFLSDLVTGTPVNKDELNAYGLSDTAGFAVCMAQITDIGEMFSIANQDLAAFAALNVFEETMQTETGCLAFQTEQNACTFLGLIYGSVNGQTLEKQIHRAIKNVQEWLDISIWVGLGATVQSIGQTPDAFRQAQEVFEQRINFGASSLLTVDHYQRIKNNEYLMPENVKKLLESSLRSGDQSAAKSAIKSTFADMAERKIIRAKVEAIAIELLLVLINVLKELKQYDHSDLTNKSIDRFFSRCVTYEDFIELLYVRALQVCETVRLSEAETGHNIIRKIVTLIEEKYFSDIKLNDIADEYFINTSYLSQLFLQETNKNFKQYLCEVRINSAKNLLENTSFSISRVAELIGYNDRAYFSKAFTKHVGVTPAQYRMANGGGYDEE